MTYNGALFCAAVLRLPENEEQSKFLTVLFSNITFKVIFTKVSDSELTNLHSLL